MEFLCRRDPHEVDERERNVVVLNNGMSIMGIGIEWQQAVKGLALLFAVAFDVYNKRRSGV